MLSYRPYVAPPPHSALRSLSSVFRLYFHIIKVGLYTFMNETLILKSPLYTDICYDIRFERYNAQYLLLTKSTSPVYYS